MPVGIAIRENTMNKSEWLDSNKTIERSKKKYAHFDNRTDISKAKAYISKPKNIAQHSFYPFIHYTNKMVKYNKKNGKKIKTREICYASHLDRCIYQYYAFILNEHYNKKIKELGIEKVPVAYRTDLHDSNIQSSKRAFEFIRSNPQCYVMIGDFTNFFDNLEHRYLKQQWCAILNESKLPEDHYAIFKNVTKYSKWELSDLLELNHLPNNEEGKKKLNRKRTVLTKEQYKDNRSHIVKNKLTYGIPQGSPISAVLANIYMLEADQLINEKVLQYQGFYMRYSDDFIIVIPSSDKKVCNIFNELMDLIKEIPNLTLENKKTQFFYVEAPEVINVGKNFFDDADISQKTINFLGFSYNGDKIRVRAKTISKYYYRMQRKAKAIAHNMGNVGADNLYIKYSERGANGKKRNFFTYINNAEKEFGTNVSV